MVLLCTMVAFYATSFDSIALTASFYSYREIPEGESPSRTIQLMWCLLLIAFPMALLFSESSMANLQSVSIIAAFPLGIVMIMIVFSFFRDASAFLNEQKETQAAMNNDRKEQETESRADQSH